METVEAVHATAGSPEVAERVRQFERDGFVVSRGMFSGDEMRDFIKECYSFEGKAPGRAEPNSKGSMQFYSELFRKSELIRRFITQRTLVDFVTPVAGPDLWVRWDQAVAKGPQSGVFAWHTDAGYDLLPQPHFEIWIALSESRADNGGLWVVPGSHKQRQRHRRIDNHMVAIDSERYDAEGSGKLFVQADAGDVILFSSLLLHKTYENTTSKSRWAYVAEMLKLGDFDPTIEPPYFVLSRDGAPVCEFVQKLACARDPAQFVKTLPLALRHRFGKPLVKRIRAAVKRSTPAA